MTPSFISSHHVHRTSFIFLLFKCLYWHQIWTTFNLFELFVPLTDEKTGMVWKQLIIDQNNNNWSSELGLYHNQAVSVMKHGYDTTSVWRSFTAEANLPDLNPTDKHTLELDSYWTLQTELYKLNSHCFMFDLAIKRWQVFIVQWTLKFLMTLIDIDVFVLVTVVLDFSQLSLQ